MEGICVERVNNLSTNLKTLQEGRGQNLTEFSRELCIPKSTLQSVMTDGNTTLDTLIRIANALNTSLDELVFSEMDVEQKDRLLSLLDGLDWYLILPEGRQEQLCYHLREIQKLMVAEKGQSGQI